MIDPPPPHHPDVFAGILVGGRGSRMGGRDKARLRRPDGRTTLEHIAGELAGRVATLRLAGRPDQAYPEVAARLVVDRVADAGPLGALDALLAEAPAPWCLLVACDMPQFAGELVELLTEARLPGSLAVVPRAGGHLHPTCALYSSRLAPLAARALAAQELSMRAFVQRVSGSVVNVPAALVGALANVNTEP